MLKKTVIAEEMKEKVDKIFDAWFTNETVTLEDMPNMSNILEEMLLICVKALHLWMR